MEFANYSAYRRHYTLTPSCCDYQITGLSKYEGHHLFSQDAYPQFPTPPQSTSPPSTSLDSPPYKDKSTELRTTSVIMRVTDKTISEVRPKLSSLEVEEEFVCHWLNCSRMFETLESLASHVTQTHAIASGDGLYYCRWEGCHRMDRGFNARYKMLVHVRTHTKEKPHQCQQCDKCFSRAENLKIHTRSHSGEKPYVCPVEGCNKAYSNSSDRFKHTRTHSTEKPYVCKVPGCQKRYTDPSSLRKHVKTFKHSNLEGSPVKLCDDSMEKMVHNEYQISDLAEDPRSIMCYSAFQNQLPERVKCSCNYECLEHYRKAEVYKLGSYFDGMFVSYDRQMVDSPSPTYWIQPDADRQLLAEQINMDLPLDLSVTRRNHR